MFARDKEEELQFYDLSALHVYRLFKSLYSHIVHIRKKGYTEIGYRETWNSTTATLVLLRVLSKAPIHGINILRPHPTDIDEYDGYIQ